MSTTSEKLNNTSNTSEATNITYIVDRGAAPILKSWSAEDHRRRLLNIQACEKGIRKCLKKHLITNYLPGHVSYNLGEYPSRQPYNPDEYDDNELAKLAGNGIQILQVMEDWNDLLNLHGADRWTSPNPAGMRRFINMAHKHGIKVLIYASTGYMQEDDPDMNLDWTRETPGNGNHAAHWKLIRCSPASPGWRSFMLKKTVQILEDYECDGLYNDWGYASAAKSQWPPAKDEVEAFIETPEHDAAKEDLSALVYAEVKRRGGIYKYHADFNDKPMFKEHLYDYLWVGEGIGDLEKMRTQSKTHPPYVVPHFDCRFTGGLHNEDHQFVHTIPYMQFPQLLAGRPFTGERGDIPGVHYRPAEEDETRRQWLSDWKHFQEHPEGPYIYGPWDVNPARPAVRETHAKWLKRYLPMVEEGSYAYLEITDSDLFTQALPEGIVASMYVNLESYLVLANYGEKAVEIGTTSSYVPSDDTQVGASAYFTLQPMTLLILRRV